MKKSILIIHYNRLTYPLRSTVGDYLLSFRKYSTYDCVYVNVAFGFPEFLLEKRHFSAVIFHISFLAMRWVRELFQRRTPPVARYMRVGAGKQAVKIAIAQDEFINTDILDGFLADVGVDHVLTCAGETEWPKIYPRSTASGARFHTVLTGYLDEETITRISRLSEETERVIDIGYRAWRAHPFVGRWGRHKVEVARRFQEMSDRKGLISDISMDDSDTFHGDDWFRFLARCKATIGVAGGSSILDVDGSIKRQIDEYITIHPETTFEEIHTEFLSDVEGNLSLSCISPRHLEACLTKTAQFLVEADYSGILMPVEHYFPIREDYSNLDDAETFLNDATKLAAMTDRAYARVTAGAGITYRGLVARLDAWIDEMASLREVRHGSFERPAMVMLKLWEKTCWTLVRLEYAIVRQPKNSLAYKLYDTAYKTFRRCVGRSVENRK